MDKMYCDSATETFAEYWIAKNSYTGEAFIAELKSSLPIIGVKLRNTHNAHYKNTATKKFRVSIGSSETGPWTELLTQGLEDSRNQDPPPVQQFEGEGAVTGRFIKFDLLEYLGHGGGLNYFDIIPDQSGV